MMAVGCALILFVSNIWQLFAVQIIISTGNVLAYTLLMGLSIQYIPSERRAAAMGFFQAVYGLGMDYLRTRWYNNTKTGKKV